MDLDDLDDEDTLIQDNPYQSQIDQIKEDFAPKSSISTLISDKSFIEHNELIKHNIDNNVKDNIIIDKYNKDYQIILKSIEFSGIIGNVVNKEREIEMMYRFIRETFTQRFPELEQLVPSMMDYIQCVLFIGNQSDISKVDLSSILNSHQIVSINVAASASSGKLLSSDLYDQCLSACKVVMKLDEYKALNLQYVQSKMEKIAPNLSNLVGSMIAAQLMAASGGLDALARIPACNIQVIGSQKKTMMGLTKIDKKTQRFGLFGQLDMVKLAPPDFQIKLVRMLSTNCAKAARVDYSQLNKKGELGLRFKQEMLQRFSKIQEPAPAKKIKPLVIADEKPKKKRGGKKLILKIRYRNMKERLGASEFKKYQNRLAFGEQAEQEFRSTGEGFGMIGMAGKIKISKKERKQQLTKKQKLAQMPFKNKAIPTDGATTSIAFTPISAMQLVNPAIQQQRSNFNTNDSYFNKSQGFQTVIQEKNKNLMQFLNKQ